jgi:uncharacterized phage protein (TIGR02216 family)
MRFGLGRLRLPADHFWALTPQELSAAAQAFGAGSIESLASHDLTALMAQFPDTSEFLRGSRDG